MMRFNGLIQDFVVACKQFWYLFGMFLSQFRAAFYIRKRKVTVPVGSDILPPIWMIYYDTGTSFWKLIFMEAF